MTVDYFNILTDIWKYLLWCNFLKKIQVLIIFYVWYVTLITNDIDFLNLNFFLNYQCRYTFIKVLVHLLNSYFNPTYNYLKVIYILNDFYLENLKNVVYSSDDYRGVVTLNMHFYTNFYVFYFLKNFRGVENKVDQSVESTINHVHLFH